MVVSDRSRPAKVVTTCWPLAVVQAYLKYTPSPQQPSATPPSELPWRGLSAGYPMAS